MARIFLDGEISEWDCSARWLREQLSRIGPAEDLDLHISSPGGDVMQGFAMSNLLRLHKGRKTAIVDGLCASAATLPAMACDSLRMHRLSMLMIHNPWGGAAGDAEELETKAGVLRSIEDLVTAVYVRKSGAPETTVREWMAAETWMTPDQAVSNGLCDSIVDAPVDPAMVAKARTYYAKFRNPPAALAPAKGEHLPAPVPAPKAAAPSPKRSTMDRKQMLEALAGAGAMHMLLMQQAAESPEADIQAAATQCLAENCLPMAVGLIMNLAQAEGMGGADEMSAKAKTILSVYSAAQRVTGLKEGLVGALEALQANASAKVAPAAASVDVQVEAEIQKGIKACKILPAQAAGWRASIASGDRTIADLKSFVAIALPAAPKASSEQVHGAALDLETPVADPVVADLLKDL